MVADFIGSEFWGRKFYYHQSPENCVHWYDNPKNWPHTKGRNNANNYYNYPAESLPKGGACKGRIFFERVPKNILDLFLASIDTQNGIIKHKIGYGQPYGLGSMELEITGVKCVSDANAFAEETAYPYKEATKKAIFERHFFRS